MVDNVNFNPFSGKVFTSEEIQRLDTNKDGKISTEEFSEGISWLAGGQDEEGEVAPTKNPASDNPLYKQAVNNGMNEKPANSAELKDSISTLTDEFLEAYMKENVLTPEQKQGLAENMKGLSDKFVQDYIKKNPSGPYNVSEIATDLLDKLSTGAQDYSKMSIDAAASKDKIGQNTDQKFDEMAKYAKSAGSDYLKDNEFKELKNKTIEYLMSTLLNGQADAELLAKINPKYANNSNYNLALQTINSLKNETDPEKIQTLINDAKAYLNAFIGSTETAKTNLLNAVNGSSNDKVNKEYSVKLEKINDAIIEKHIKDNNITDSKSIEKYSGFLKNVMAEFLKQYKGNAADVEAEYNKFVTAKTEELSKVQNILEGIKGNNDAGLRDALKNAGAYINSDEKEQIFNKFSEYALDVMRGGSDALMKSIDKNYATNPLYLEAKKLADGLESSANPQADLDKIMSLMKQFAEKMGTGNIVSGYNKDMQIQAQIKASKTPNYRDTSLTAGLLHYGTNTTTGNDQKINYRHKVDDKGVPQLDNQDDNRDYQATMNQLRSRIQAKYKMIMGDAYNQALVDSCFNEAMANALKVFSNNEPTVDEAVRKNGSRKGDNFWCNISDIVNQTLKEMDTIAEQKLKGTGAHVVDKNSALDATGLKNQNSDVNRTYARNLLRPLEEVLKNQIKAKLGSKYNEADISKLLNEAITSSTNSIGRGNINSGKLIDNFFSKFNALYADYVVQNKLY